MSHAAPPQAALQEALGHLHAGNTGAAEAVLTAQLQAQPGDSNALHLMGLIRMQQQRFGEAENLLARSLQISPNHAPARLNYGRALTMVGRDADAIQAFFAVVEKQPDMGEARLELGNALHRMDRTAEAEPHLRVAVETMPRAPLARLGLGAALLDLNKDSEAAEHLEQGLALTRDPAQRAQLQNNLAVARVRLHRNEAALESIAEAQRVSPTFQYLDGVKSQLLQRLNRNEEALALLGTLLQREPENPGLHYGYNSLLYRLGRNGDLFKSFDAAPRSRALLMSKGAMLAKMERFVEAQDIFAELVAAHPGDPAVISHASTTLTALKRYDEAVALLDGAMKAMPGNPLLIGHMSHTLIVSDAPERAAALSQQAMALEPNNQSHIALLATAWRLMGDPRHDDVMGYDRFVRVFDLDPPRGFSDMESFNAELAGYLDTLHPDTREYFDQSLRFGTQTPEQIFGGGHRLVDLLQERLTEAVNRYIAELPGDSAHPFTGKRRSGFAYSGSWSSRLRDSGFHMDHIHPSGWISSCYYVAVPDAVKDESQKQGWIKFGQPTMRQDLPALHSVQPRPGRLVLFPSFMWHGTNPFRAASPRTTIAFDVVPT